MEQHVGICRELLQLSEHELRILPGGGTDAVTQCTRARRELLQRLETANQELQRAVNQWQALTPAQRQALPEISALVRQGQDLILKLTAVNRELEQAWGRRGTAAPSASAAVSARPHFVAELYRKMSGP